MIKQRESFVCYSRIGYANKLVYYIRVVDVLDDSIYDAKVGSQEPSVSRASMLPYGGSSNSALCNPTTSCPSGGCDTFS